jgi:O-antigen ligase
MTQLSANLQVQSPNRRGGNWIFIAVIAVMAMIIVAGKITLLIAGLAGLLIAAAIIRWPVVGVIGVIFAGTSLQISGSEYSTGLPLSLSRIFGILTTIAFLWRLYQGQIRLTYAPAMKPLMWFMGVVLLGVFIQPDHSAALEGLLKMTQVCLVYVLIANFAVDRPTVRWLCIAVTATVVLASLIAIAEHFLPSLQISSDDPRLAHGTLGAVVDEDSAESGDIARVSGGVGDANYFAYTVAAAFPLTLYWWRQARSVRVKFLVLIVALIQGLGLTFSYTRTGFLGLAVATIYLACRRKLPVVPMILLGIIAAGIGSFYIPPALIERMTSSRYLEEGSTPFRRDLLIGGWTLFLEKPILGYGYGQFGPQFVKMRQAGESVEVIEELIDEGFEDLRDLRCHNTYLEVAVEYGIIGVIPFFWFLGRLIGDLREAENAAKRKHRADQAELAVVLTAGLIGFYVCAFLAHSKIVNILWILAGLTASLRRATISSSDLSE